MCPSTNHDDRDQSARPRVGLWHRLTYLARSQRPAGTADGGKMRPCCASPERVDEARRRPSTAQSCTMMTGVQPCIRVPDLASPLGLRYAPPSPIAHRGAPPYAVPRRSGGAHVHPLRTEGALQPRPSHACPRTPRDLCTDRRGRADRHGRVHNHPSRSLGLSALSWPVSATTVAAQ